MSKNTTDLPVKEQKKQERLEAWTYGLGGIPASMGTQLKNGYHMAFLTEIAGLNPLAIGTINTALTVWDAINDILIGSIADKTDSRMGKYRPHMLWGIIAWTIISILMFCMPGFGADGKMIYYVALLFFWSVACTGFVVPWQSLNSVMSTNVDQRNFMLMLRMVMGTLFATALGVVMPIAVKRMPDGKGYQIVAIATALICLLFGLISIHGARHKDYPGAIQTPPSVNLKGTFALFKTRPVLCVALMLGCSYLSSGIGSANTIFFYKYVVGDLKIASIGAVFSMFAGLVFVPFVPKLYKAIGRVNTYLLGVGLQVVQSVLLIVLRQNIPVWLLLVSAFLYTCGYSVMNMTILSFVPDCADYSELHLGAPNAGRISSIVSFMKKFMNAFSTTIIGAALAVGGYVDASSARTPELINAIIFVQAVVPLILIALALLALKAFPVKGEYAVRMREKLKQVRAQRLGNEATEEDA